MNTTEQVRDKSPISYSQIPPPAIYNDPPQLSPYGQPPNPHGQATLQHHPVTIGVVHVVNVKDPNNPANSKTPVRMKCPACGENITTVTKYVTDCDSYIKAIVLLLVGCICLFWMPLVCKCCKNVIHSCPKCEAVCGRYGHYDNRVHAMKVM
ncbi:lipopolysaccharide-induced tumor necrosis factor-alpha factor homolog [Mytilus trossulus]|uniref:lipopolysaccharide-induced tumor necrosis factor-alpha factor homolog n=1 Tax=Mytilus trossulus TaxID=6551 RepID=UPI003005FE94